MKITWKSLAELCLYMSIVSTFPTVFITDMMLWPIVLCCCGAVLLMEVLCAGHLRKWRFAAVVPALVSFGFMLKPMDAVIITPAVIYAIIVVVKGEREAEYPVYKALFTRMAVAWIVYAGLMLLGAYIGARKEETTGEAAGIVATGMLIYGSVFLLAGTVLLKKLRVNIPSSRANGAKATLRYVGAMLGSLAILAAVSDGLMLAFGYLSKAILTASAYAMMLPMKVLDTLNRSADFAEKRRKLIEEAQDFDSEEVFSGGRWGDVVNQAVQQTERVKKFPWALFIALTVVLLAVLIIVLRKSSKLTFSTGLAEDTPVELDAERKKTDRRSPRERIRKVYRGYIKSLENYGVAITRSDMSEDVLLKTERGRENAAARDLRKIYVRARYDMENPVAESMVGDAERAVKEIF